MTQDRSKTGPRRSLRGVFFASIFVFDFGRFGVRFGLPLGALLGANIGHFWHRFVDDFCMSFRDRPKSGQEDFCRISVEFLSDFCRISVGFVHSEVPKRPEAIKENKRQASRSKNKEQEQTATAPTQRNYYCKIQTNKTQR